MPPKKRKNERAQREKRRDAARLKRKAEKEMEQVGAEDVRDDENDEDHDDSDDGDVADSKKPKIEEELVVAEESADVSKSSEDSLSADVSLPLPPEPEEEEEEESPSQMDPVEIQDPPPPQMVMPTPPVPIEGVDADLYLPKNRSTNYPAWTNSDLLNWLEQFCPIDEYEELHELVKRQNLDGFFLPDMVNSDEMRKELGIPIGTWRKLYHHSGAVLNQYNWDKYQMELRRFNSASS